MLSLVGRDEETTTVENADTIPKLETLHEDAIEQVITKLVPQDLCSFSQTSKSIEAKTSRPKFWQRINVRKEKIKQEGLPKLFIIDKFKEVQRIDLSRMRFTAEELIANLRAIAGSSVVELNLEKVGVYKVPTELLANVASRLKNLNLSCSRPTIEQCVAVLQACVPPAAITHINLEGCANLPEVPVNLLAKALGHLTQINLSFAYLSRQQCLAVVETCAGSPSLVELSLQDAENLEDVPPQTLGQAVGSLAKIDLGCCDLRRDQSISVLNACAASSTLKHVNMMSNNLRQVPAELLARAVGNLQSVNLGGTRLTTEQLNAVLKKCKSSSSKLTDIDLSGADLRQVAPQLMEEALRNLQRMRVHQVKVTTEQMIGILNTVLTSSPFCVEKHFYGGRVCFQ